MCGRAGIILLAIFSATISANAATSLADSRSLTDSMRSVGSEIKSRFDLPAEPLDKALRDLALQTNWNISYQPSIVSGLRAPAIKGELTVGGALSQMLKGTSLRAVNVNEDTIQILEKPLSSPYGTDSAESAGTDDKARDKKELEELVVTGSHIRGASVASPIIEIDREEIDRSGYTSVANLMLSLPQNFGGGYNAATMVGNTFVNSAYAGNPTGASVPNLRGLGSGSTLTLIDGHRMASGLPGGGADISSIPIDAVERIEAVTDSASSIYGSDAVAGVVNIILKRGYDGANTGLSYSFAHDGGGTEKRLSQVYGTHWNSGDFLIAYEHAQQDAVDARDRQFTSSSLEPFSLLPQTKSNSVTLSATQDLFAETAVFVDGLYVARDTDYFESNPLIMAPVEYPSTLRKYAVAGGLNFNLVRDWKATLLVNAAEDATDSDSINLITPPMIASVQRIVGTMRAIEANANGDIATLPAGVVRLALGAGYRREGFSDSLGFTSSSLANRAEGTRTIRYAFGELSIPLVRHSQRPGLNALDLVISARNERYSDFGAKTTPKVGLVYFPISSLKVRSTWGKAFRAPNLYDADGIQQLIIIDLPNTVSPTGSSTALVRYGGNPNLQPETADSWSIGADYTSPETSGLQASTTFFDIKYTNRIASIGDFFTALTNPLDASFLAPSPSPSLAQSVYAGYPPSQIFNETGASFDPSKIGAIVDGRMLNVAGQTARGVDLNVGYKVGGGSSTGLLFLNGTYLDLIQKNTPKSPEQTLSGLAFYPPKFRLRGGATWRMNAWALASTVNYLPRETNNQVVPDQNVDSWTTVDASLRYAPLLPGILSGFHFTLAALNIFDRNPPFVLLPANVAQGINYDSSNANPMGRYFSLQISKEW